VLFAARVFVGGEGRVRTGAEALMDITSPVVGKAEAASPADIAAIARRVSAGRERILAEIHKVIVGQDEVIDQVLMALLTGGHCLITGVPGLAKTLLIKTVAQILDLSFKRIQFTPDLMPADITGTEVLDEQGGHRSLRFVKGPIFAQIILADEINRTPPKTQAALLEAMQEYHVTAAGRTYPLDRPFFVLATQNPIELEGTYPLPEAQLDRFMFNIVMTYLPEDEEVRVVTETTGVTVQVPQAVLGGPEILEIQQLVRQVLVAEDVARYAVRLVDASRPGRQSNHGFVREWVKWGAGLRASQALILAGKARALLQDRYHVSVADIQALAHPVLRHRVIPNFYAESERISADNLVDRLLEAVPPPRSGM
jgi:MoxR-like ATPase